MGIFAFMNKYPYTLAVFANDIQGQGFLVVNSTVAFIGGGVAFASYQQSLRAALFTTNNQGEDGRKRLFLQICHHTIAIKSPIQIHAFDAQPQLLVALQQASDYILLFHFLQLSYILQHFFHQCAYHRSAESRFQKLTRHFNTDALNGCGHQYIPNVLSGILPVHHIQLKCSCNVALTNRNVRLVPSVACCYYFV